jgi:hypothetical protein
VVNQPVHPVADRNEQYQRNDAAQGEKYNYYSRGLEFVHFILLTFAA